ncbi:hypothetical protein D6C97_05242 [Aureobasidium pullulans]|nr:hypothetical protein D6D29_08105 [Aureobasidium pullulans]THY56093.1 hypothetical protein D6C97_05242 [Aureobasidium pullulans]
MGYSQGPLSFRTALIFSVSLLGMYWFLTVTNTTRSPLISDTTSPALWKYQYPRDANHYGLSAEQCDAAFPGFYGDIESALASRKDNPILKGELDVQEDHCLVRVLIYDAEIFIIQGHQNQKCWMGRWHERTSGFLHMIHQAIVSVSPETIPNVEFVLDLDDDPQRPLTSMWGKEGTNQSTVWGLTRLAEQRHIWLIPDYAYWAWPSALVASHSQIRRKVRESNAAWPWSKKHSKAVWRGDANLNKDIRQKLIKTAEGTVWGDVRVCDIYSPETKQYCMTQDQFCRYKFPIHTEGYTYSGRLKYLQLCNSAPVVHKLQWLEHHHGLMRPDGPQQNFIQVERDWSDLDEMMTYYLAHEDEAMAIAQNNYATFHERYLTTAATACYWRRLFAAWASVQGFEPQLYETRADGEVAIRGIPFEAYALNAEKPMPNL